MFLRIDKLQVEMPAPTEPDPNAAAAVQELLGGRFGEMSTLMNYMYQSFNFRGRDKLRPYYELIANIATEELGHIELVAASINSLLTGVRRAPADPRPAPRASRRLQGRHRQPHHFIVTGHGAGGELDGPALARRLRLQLSGNLILDLLHNFFLENGARTNKLRVYEMTEDPAARQMLGYLFVRGGVHAHAYALALEELTGVEMKKMLPIPKIENEMFPRRGRSRPRACTASSTGSAPKTTRRWPRSGRARRSTAAGRSR